MTTSSSVMITEQTGSVEVAGAHSGPRYHLTTARSWRARPWSLPHSAITDCHGAVEESR